MSMTGNTIKALVQQVGRDRDGDVYTDQDLLEVINNAQRTTCLVRPDACSVTASVQLAQAAQQSLSSSYRRLLGLNVNTGADGETIGDAIIGPTPMEEMDAFLPGWRTTTGEAVEQYIYNQDTPRTWYVYPYVASTWHVEGRWAKNPTALVALSDTMDLDDVYEAAVFNYTMYLLFSRDDETTPNGQRAQAHRGEFYNVLGLKTQADAGTDPNTGVG